MDPEDPESALRIVAEYAHVLEHDEAQPLPAPVRQGAYPERTVKSAILTRATKLPAMDQQHDRLIEIAFDRADIEVKTMPAPAVPFFLAWVGESWTSPGGDGGGLL